MIVHKILRGDNAGLYLPFGLSRLEAFADLYGPEGFFQEKFMVDGYTIEVQQAPPFQYVRITEEGVYFEFATSANPIVTGTVTQGAIDFEAYTGCVIGVSASKSGVNAKVLKKRRSTETGSDVSAIERGYQVDLITEPVAYPQRVANGPTRWHYPTALYESYAPGNPYSGVHTRNSQSYAGVAVDSTTNNPWEATRNVGTMFDQVQRDIAYDVPFEQGQKRQPVKNAYIKGAADWPRANGLQVVTDPTYGSREFAIYVDTFNQFAIFPTSQITAVSGLTQNVDELYVQRLAPALPAWAFVPPALFKDTFASDPTAFIDNNPVDAPELDWKFNHLGTKCASIVYEREPYNNDTTYWAIDPHATHPFNATRFNTRRSFMGVQARHGTQVSPGYNEQRYFVAPGAIEFTITITLTGPNPEDYSASMSTVREVLRPTTSERAPLLVGYVWYDNDLASAGDFVAVLAEHWGNASTAPDVLSTNILTVRNLDTDDELVSWPMPGDFHLNQVGATIMSADLRTLSFALQVQWLEQATRASVPKKVSAGGGVGDVAWNYFHFAVAIVYQGEIIDWIYPDSMAAGTKTALNDGMIVSGRAVINALVLGDANWALVPLNQSLGGFAADTGFTGYRDYWAYGAGYKATPVLRPVDADDIEALWNGIWKAGLGTGEGNEHLWLCTTPKWGWHCYESVAQMALRLAVDTTFYMHPNGTWAFWNNAWIYNPQGTIDPVGASWDDYNTLDYFDETQLEHVIFDKVSFAFINANETVTRRGSTFLVLYNSAVTKGIDSDTLEAGIETIAPVDLRATFSKGSKTDSGSTFLNLQADWDGVSYWYWEYLVQSLGTTLAQAPGWGKICGINFNQPWGVDSDLVDRATSPCSLLHVRFANPSLINA